MSLHRSPFTLHPSPFTAEASDNEGAASSAKGIERMLEEAEASGIEQLDATSLKQLLLSLEKKITKNQKMRMKYADEAEKFMDSEIELHAEVENLFAVAASPELYPILVDAGAVDSILGLLAHENTDISIAIVNLIQEMTDADAVSEQLEAAMTFVHAFTARQGVELVVQNLSRLDQDSEEDEQGVHNSLSIIENLVEISPLSAVSICDKTHILSFLLRRCAGKTFGANKLYASEVLSILLEADPRNGEKLCALSEVDGMDSLLQCVALYRKKEVSASDEQECVENLFLCLCAVLQSRENQGRFLQCEGFELLIRCLKEQQYAAGCTITALSYSLTRNRACCERFVDVGGLKYVFPLLTGGGVKKILKKKASGERRNVEESAISILAQLCMYLCRSTHNDYSARLLNKFVEREHEKLERCVELYGKYSRLLEFTDEQIEATRAELVDSGADEEELAEFDEGENINSKRLEGGLFLLQQLSVILAFVCISDEGCLKRAASRLVVQQLSANEVLETVRGVILTLRAEEMDEGGAGSSSSSQVSSKSPEEKQLDDEYRQTLTEWCAVLASSIIALEE
ncbi:Catenin-beta-like protein [Ochromonadaceae sp. CCMP2298]|nr:Catenin-beta-like protein [Ochromonadaceae sp. CCMP2298]